MSAEFELDKVYEAVLEALNEGCSRADIEDAIEDAWIHARAALRSK
jgi:hypothetical protein